MSIKIALNIANNSSFFEWINFSMVSNLLGDPTSGYEYYLESFYDELGVYHGSSLLFNVEKGVVTYVTFINR